MKHFKIISGPALIVALAVSFAAVPVFAEHGSTGVSGDDNPGSSQVSADTSGGTNETEANDNSTKGQLTAETHKNRSATEQEHVCEAHKQGLEQKFSRITANAQRIDDRITDVFNKTQAFQTKNNLNVSNYNDLVAAANTAKANADSAIANLKAVTPSLDCNNTSVASDVAGFKDAAAKTRDALKTYRTAVKDLIKALLTAKEGTGTTGSPQSEGSNQ